MRSAPPGRLEEDSTPCDRVADLMSDYLDGELETGAAHDMALHLSRCPGCARMAAELALTIAALHRLRRSTP